MSDKKKHRKPQAKIVAEEQTLFERGAVWLVLMAAVLVYANTFTAGFTLDDVPIIEENRIVESLANIPRIFTTNYWGETDRFQDKSLYRPLTVSTYALNYAAHGLKPAGYHVANVLLHALVSGLLFVLIRNLLGNLHVAFAAGLLFAIHPIHTEAVSGIVGRAEIMALLGILICCLGYERAFAPNRLGGSKEQNTWMAVSLSGFLFGMFSKETGVVAPAFIILMELFFPERRRLFRWNRKAILLFVLFAAAFALFMIMRENAVKTVNINVGFVGVPVAERWWTAFRVILEYIGLLIAPITLSADYWVTDVPISRAPWEPGVAISLVVIALSVVATMKMRMKNPALAMGIGLFLIALFPVSNIPFAIGVMKAERILYTPSVGFVIALAALFPLLWSHTKTKQLGWVILWVVIIALSLRTWNRNYDWKSNTTLAEATLKTSPHSFVFNSIMANEYRKVKDNQSAERYLMAALAQRPGDASTCFNLGNIELDENRYDKAIDYYNQALRSKPNDTPTMNNLGMAYYRSNRLLEAADIFFKLKNLRPNDPAPYFNLVSVYVKMGDGALAIPLAEQSVRLFPSNAGSYWNLGAVYQMVGRQKEADEAFERARSLDSRIAETLDVKGRLD